MSDSDLSTKRQSRQNTSCSNVQRKRRGPLLLGISLSKTSHRKIDCQKTCCQIVDHVTTDVCARISRNAKFKRCRLAFKQPCHFTVVNGPRHFWSALSIHFPSCHMQRCQPRPCSGGWMGNFMFAHGGYIGFLLDLPYAHPHILRCMCVLCTEYTVHSVYT